MLTTERTPGPGSTQQVDTQDWVFSRTWHILGRCVGIRSNSDRLAVDAGRFLRSFSKCPLAGTPPEMMLSIMVAPSDALGQAHTICRDDQAAWNTHSYWHIFRLLEWHLVSFLSEQVTDRYLIHGGAVAHQGFGIIMPGASESGKSTTTQALVLRGFDYYSDELAVLDPAAGLLEPFPKPISCKDPGLFPALAGQGGHWFGPESAEGNDVWYWHPADLHPDAIGPPVPVRYIVFPHFAPGVEPQLEPLAAGETMRRLLENSVNFARFGRSGLELLAELAKTARGFSLVANHPQTAAELVSQLD
jgi:hypothetical protein